MNSAPGPASTKHGGLPVWPWISLTVILVAALYSDVSRFENPSGEKYIPGYYLGGQMDFTYPYLGARALLAGENPYTTKRFEFTHSVFRPELIDGEWYKQLYPPGHLLSYVPLVLIYGDDSVAAGRLFFRLSLVCLGLLGFVTWRLAQDVRGEKLSPLFIFLALVALTLQPGVQLGLERGQSDLLAATLCWGAVFLLSRDWVATALFMCVWATSIKGYPLLFGVGVGLVALRPGRWVRALLGTFTGVALFVLPAARFLGDGLKGTLYRSSMFWGDWFNQGFKNVVVHVVSVEASDRGRSYLVLSALLVTLVWAALSWWNRNGGTSAQSVLSWSLFCTAALLTVVGYSALSVTYNQIFVLPGVVLLAATQDRIVERLGIGRPGAHALGVLITAAGYCLFLGRWMPYFPLGGLGLVILLLVLAAVGGRTLLRMLPTLKRPAPPASAG